MNAIIIEPNQQATASVIWLHGLGADGNDFAPIVPHLNLGNTHSIRFIFPHAPVRPITLNAGYAMPAWYDIYSLDKSAEEDETGIRQGAQLVEQFIASEIQSGIPAKRIVLAGFSQGGALALHTGLRYPQRLAGIAALSTYLPLAKDLDIEAAPINSDIPILLIHGTYDATVRLEWGEAAKNILLKKAYPLTWKTYPMGHEVCAEEIQAIGEFIRATALN